MKNQPAWLAAALKSLALAAAGGTAALLAKGGIQLDATTIAGLGVIYLAVETAGTAFVWSKVVPMAKVEARLAQDHPAALAALKRQS